MCYRAIKSRAMARPHTLLLMLPTSYHNKNLRIKGGAKQLNKRRIRGRYAPTNRLVSHWKHVQNLCERSWKEGASRLLFRLLHTHKHPQNPPLTPPNPATNLGGPWGVRGREGTDRPVVIFNSTAQQEDILSATIDEEMLWGFTRRFSKSRFIR